MRSQYEQDFSVKSTRLVDAGGNGRFVQTFGKHGHRLDVHGGGYVSIASESAGGCDIR